MSSAATSLGSNDVYTGASNNILQFRGIASGSNISVVSTNTTLIISNTIVNTSLGSNAIYSGTSNNDIQFRGISSLSTLGISATSTNLVIDIATTGVTAGIYGNSTTIPRITVDTYGRLSSVVDTAAPYHTTSSAQLLGDVFYTLTTSYVILTGGAASSLRNFTFSNNVFTYTGPSGPLAATMTLSVYPNTAGGANICLFINGANSGFNLSTTICATTIQHSNVTGTYLINLNTGDTVDIRALYIQAACNVRIFLLTLISI